MRKLLLAAALLAGSAFAALAQQQTGPQNSITCAYNTTPPAVATGFFGYVQCDSLGRLLSVGSGPYPAASTPITANVVGTTGAVSANLPATAGKTTYICGYQVQANANAAISVPNASITGTNGGLLPFIEAVAATPAVGTTAQVFTPCIPASAVNTQISVNAGAAGTGGNTAIYAWGFQQ